jgi:hypothetical protein
MSNSARDFPSDLIIGQAQQESAGLFYFARPHSSEDLCNVYWVAGEDIPLARQFDLLYGTVLLLFRTSIITEGSSR